MQTGKLALTAGFSIVLALAGCSSDPEDSSSNSAPGTSNAQTSVTGGIVTATTGSIVTATTAAPMTASTAPDEPIAAGSDVFVSSSFEPIRGKRVGLIANQTSLTASGHLADVMATDPTVELVRLFSPEHGLRGDAPAGQQVKNSVDPATGLDVVSLYGTTRKPTQANLADLDVLVFDIQDVGARFYTFISTMGLAMQAAAEADIDFIVLDRPNPQGGWSIEGFTRTPEQDSFVGLYPIPATYAMTIGELALAIKGEGWLPGLETLQLSVIELSGWQRDTTWPDWSDEWVPPSPALPRVESAQTYPGVVLFEATTLYYGRGGESPFSEISGEGLDGRSLAEDLISRDLAGVLFVAQPGGIRIQVTDDDSLAPVAVGVHLLEAFMAHSPTPIIDRPMFFDQLAGTDQVRIMLEAGVPATEIIKAWSADVKAFELVRAKYLLY